MTTGAPIYLVSACASGEEFVSAFRRYADRNGVVFVPIAQPLPPGKKGRFALTLKDGGVMVEGEAEVVSSARTPSVLYGRVGMTLKFTEPDDPSKTILGELEKARLSMKPAAPSVAPRPATVPAEPRSTPPAPTGRIDAVNALAECVAIGDLSTLGGDDAIPPKMGAKFVVPSIPPVAGGPRPKASSVPPPPVPVPTATTMGMPPLDKKPATGNQPVIPRQAVTPTSVPITPPPPQPPAAPIAARAATPPAATPVVKETVMGIPPLDKGPAVAAPIVPASAPAAAVVAGTELRDDPTMPTPTRVAAAAAAASRDKGELHQTVRGPAPGVDLVGKKIDLNETMRGPAPKPAAPLPGAVRTGGTVPPPLPTRATPPTATPAVPRAPAPTPAVATPTVLRPPAPTPSTAIPTAIPADIDEPDDADEPTDLTSIPIDPMPVAQVGAEKFESSGRIPRRTVIGVAVVPSGVHVLPAAPAHVTEEEARDTSVMEVPDEPSGPVMITSSLPTHDPPPVDPRGATMTAEPAYRADDDRLPPVRPTGPTMPAEPAYRPPAGPTIEESTPSGDWTMTPGEHGPTIAPRAVGPQVEVPDPEEGAPIKKIPAGPQTGDWMIALDPSQPDGWSEPSRVEKRPAGELPPGPPVSTVSSAKDLDSAPKSSEPKAADAEPKVQVDPTLIEPLTPLQPLDDFDDEPQLPPPPTGSQPIPMVAMGASQQMSAMPGGMPTPVPGTMMTPMPMPGAIPGSYVTPIPGQLHLASASGQVPAFPMDRNVSDAGTGFFVDTNQQARFGRDSAPSIDAGASARKRRLIVIGVSAGIALLLVIVLAVVLGGGGNKAKGPDPVDEHGMPPPKGSDAQPPKGSDAPIPKGSDASLPIKQPAKGSDQAIVAAPPPDAAEVAAAPPDAVQVATATECEVDVVSTPAGADIVLDKNVIGTTPTKIKLPCGVESDLQFKKARYMTGERAITPKPEGGKPLRIALAKVTFIVKVSSSPPGATIFLGAKSLGITPAAVKLPAFEMSTLKLTKDGYSPDIQKIQPKTNNLSISSTLKKLPKKGVR